MHFICHQTKEIVYNETGSVFCTLISLSKARLKESEGESRALNLGPAAVQSSIITFHILTSVSRQVKPYGVSS